MSQPKFSRRLFRVGNMSAGRIEAFSDGVFSIIMTLLVLEIHVPSVGGPDITAALARSLIGMTPKFLSYILSFVIVCVWWVAHHSFFRQLRRVDRGLLWFNSLFLLWLAFIPFPTALLGDYPHEKVAVVFYGVVMFLAGLSFTWMRYYAFYVAELVADQIDPKLLRRAMTKSALNPILHSLAVIVAPFSVRVAIALYVIVPLLFFLPSDLETQI